MAAAADQIVSRADGLFLYSDHILQLLEKGAVVSDGPFIRGRHTGWRVYLGGWHRSQCMQGGLWARGSCGWWVKFGV